MRERPWHLVARSQLAVTAPAAREPVPMAEGEPPEPGKVIQGTSPCHRSPHDVAICDLTRAFTQDAATASHVMSTVGNGGTVIRA